MAANVQDIQTRADETPTLNKALVAARKEISNPQFDSENPHFRNKFASLKAVYESVMPALLDHGITVVQDFHSREGMLVCRTHLIHESGETQIYFSPPMEPTKRDPQGWASASTYARRYGLMSVGAVVGDPDDDGNAASESAFSSNQQRSKLRNQLLAAAKDGDDAKVVEITSGFDNDQKAEMWGVLSKPQKTLIKEATERAKESSDE